MNTNNVSNLFKYLNDKYGKKGVGLLRFVEFTVKKMVDYRNHRRFMLSYIKVRVTPVSCRVRNPLQVKTAKSYEIIQKLKNNCCIKGLETLIAFYTCMSIICLNSIPS